MSVWSINLADRVDLRRGARCYSAPHADVARAKIVLLAAEELGSR
jgi:hypothetical protein